MSSVVAAASCELIEKLAESMGQSRSAALRTVIERGFAAMRGGTNTAPQSSAPPGPARRRNAASYPDMEGGHG